MLFFYIFYFYDEWYIQLRIVCAKMWFGRVFCVPNVRKRSENLQMLIK